MRRAVTSMLLAGAFAALPSLALAAGDSGTVDERAIKNVNFFTSSPVTRLATTNYNGTIVGGPEWVRPFADGTCCSALGPVRYSVQAFHVGTAGAYDVTSVQTGWDGYIFLYVDSFDPASQTVNFVAGDDDGGGGIGTSDLIGVNLEANRTYYVVTTGFELGEEGEFTNSIDGTGPITLGAFRNEAIPTLGHWGILAFVLAVAGAGFLWVRRGLVG